MTIPAEGPVNARIMLIGDCPGDAEIKMGRLGKPIAGLAGKTLDAILDETGLVRELMYVTNVMQVRPPDNDFTHFYDGKEPKPELVEAYERLRCEIASVRPNVIVPLGNEAMKAVLGYSGIMHWRGSILDTPLGKVIPTIHPAAVMREWTYRPAVVADFNRIAEESEYAEVKRMPRTLVTSPSYEVVLETLERLQSSEYVSFDIETESDQITCIGLSDRPDWAICIPFWYGASGSFWSADQERIIWERLRVLLEGEHPRKVAHNGSYDIEYLERTVGIRPTLHMDTMLAFHCLYSELPKRLDYLTSIYTDQPYYKYQRTDSEGMEEYFRYNATDACVTMECATRLMDELDEANQRSFYESNIHGLVYPLLDMQQRGVRFDVDSRDRARRAIRSEIAKLQTELEGLVGHPLNTASHPQMTFWLYNELKIPTKFKHRKATGVKTLVADEEVLNAIYQETKNEAIGKVLEIREKSKILSNYLEVKLDTDKRIRCSYLITGTETGRLSSRSTSRGTGTNLQNIPGGMVKRLFLADEGELLINVDLSQAEARVVAYVSGETRLIKIFEDGGDIHRKNAANIFGLTESEVTDEQRQMAKRVVHASNYGMGPRTFSSTTGIPEGEAKRLLYQYFATYPRIKLWHMAIQDKLKRSRCLTNPLGRKRTFFNRWGDSVIKEGLAFIPQSTVADIMNLALIDLHREGCTLLLQVHDSIVLQCKPEDLVHTVASVRKALTRPIEIGGRVMTIPCDFKVGKNWEDMEKYTS